MWYNGHVFGWNPPYLEVGLLPPPPTGPGALQGSTQPPMKLYNKQHQKARALKMLEAKILKGQTHQEIAQDFGVAPSTVAKAMSLAKKGDLIIAFEDRLHQELLPLAYQAITASLQDGNAKVALEIFKGTNILKKTPTVSRQQQQDADDLAAYIFSKRTQTLLEETSIDVTPIDPTPVAPGLPGDDSSGNPATDPASPYSEASAPGDGSEVCADDGLDADPDIIH